MWRAMKWMPECEASMVQVVELMVGSSGVSAVSAARFVP
jgi:hypothetical protein